VFSAVRIPPDFQSSTVEKVMQDPRNIARYLVNRFVGENYQYLD